MLKPILERHCNSLWSVCDYDFCGYVNCKNYTYLRKAQSKSWVAIHTELLR